MAANIKGSNNIIGIQNPVVDDLITKLIAAQEKSDYVAYVKALDRVLLFENYVIFQWHPFCILSFVHMETFVCKIHTWGWRLLCPPRF